MKSLIGILVFVLLAVMAVRLGCFERSPPIEVPSSASYSKNIYKESGFMAMDGHMLKVFTLSPPDLLSWKKNVETYAASPWRICPADDLTQELIHYCPPAMFRSGGGEYIVMYKESDHAELFYISSSGECVWFAQW